MKTIQLTNGAVAIVDNADWPWLRRFRWYGMKSKYATYAARRRGKKKILMHREIMQPLPGFCIDHQNHNGLDNRRSNIRLCTYSQNAQNRKPVKGASSRYKGVHRGGDGKYRAYIYFDGRLIRLGAFEDEIQAAVAYDEAAVKKFGDFAYLNFSKTLRRSRIRRKIKTTRGQIFGIEFRKRSTGEVRKMQARIATHCGLKNATPPYSPRKHRLIIVYDVAAGGYRAVPLDTIERLTINGVNYKIL